jgi:hypothetical protein
METKDLNKEWIYDDPVMELPPNSKEVYRLIQDFFNITPDVLKPFIDSLIWSRYYGCYDFLDNALKEDKKAAAQFYEIKQAIKGVKLGKYKTIEVQIKLNKGLSKTNETVVIDHPKILPGIIKYLQGLQKGSPVPKAKRGNPEMFLKNAFIEEGVKKCFDFLKKNWKQNSKIERDYFYFAGLALSLTGAVLTPEQMNETPDVYRENIHHVLKRFK